MYDFAVLRTLRQRSDMTIADLSARTGISPAVISKLERNQTGVELSTLFRLSRAFGLNAADLLRLAESRTAHRIDETTHRTGDFSFREIGYANTRILLGEARAGGQASRPEVHGDDFEICWALEGEIRITLPHEKHTLSAGQCIQFDAVLEHRYEVLKDCRIVIIHLKKEKRF